MNNVFNIGKTPSHIKNLNCYITSKQWEYTPPSRYLLNHIFTKWLITVHKQTTILMIPLMQIIKIMCIWAHKPYMLTRHAKIKQYTIMACICLNLYKKSKIIYIMLKSIGPKLSIKTYLLLKKNLIHDHNGQANLKNPNGQKDEYQQWQGTKAHGSSLHFTNKIY